jgi:hypothetical protein
VGRILQPTAVSAADHGPRITQNRAFSAADHADIRGLHSLFRPRITQRYADSNTLLSAADHADTVCCRPRITRICADSYTLLSAADHADIRGVHSLCRPRITRRWADYPLFVGRRSRGIRSLSAGIRGNICVSASFSVFRGLTNSAASHFHRPQAPFKKASAVAANGSAASPKTGPWPPFGTTHRYDRGMASFSAIASETG